MAEEEQIQNLDQTTNEEEPQQTSGEQDEEYIALPPNEEVLRLRKLPVDDLINELFFSRQRLKNFLQDKGIPIPEIIFDDDSHKNLLDLASSVFIERFTRDEITGIGPDADAVNSTVKSFVMLFDSLISTNAFEEVMVSVEGMDEVMTVKQLLEDYDSSKIDEEKKVVITVKDLTDQLEALIDEDSSGSKNLEGVDDEAIAATRETGEGDDKAFNSKLSEGSYSFSEFSPFISQDTYNNLFSVAQKGAGEEIPQAETVETEPEKQEEQEEEPKAEILPEQFPGADFDDEEDAEDEELFDDNAEVKDEELFDDNAEVKDEELFDDNAEVNDKELFDDFNTFEEKADTQPDVVDNKDVSTDDIEALLAAPKKLEQTENEKPDTLSVHKDETESSDFDEDDIEKLVASATQKEEPENGDLGEDDIEKLVASAAQKEETEEFSEDYIDKLVATAKADSGNEDFSLDEIEKLVSSSQGEAAPEKLSESDIEDIVASAAEDSITNKNFDNDLAGSSTSVKDRDKAVSMDDLSNLNTMASPDEDWEKTVKAKTKTAYKDDLISIERIPQK